MSEIILRVPRPEVHPIRCGRCRCAAWLLRLHRTRKNLFSGVMVDRLDSLVWVEDGCGVPVAVAQYAPHVCDPFRAVIERAAAATKARETTRDTDDVDVEEEGRT